MKEGFERKLVNDAKRILLEAVARHKYGYVEDVVFIEIAFIFAKCMSAINKTEGTSIGTHDIQRIVASVMKEQIEVIYKYIGG